MENSTTAPVLAGYGYVSDSDETLKSKTGGKFGGNFGVAFLTKFAYNENVAKEGQPARAAIEIVVQVGDSEYKDWISPITKVYGKNNVELTDVASPEYIAKYNEEMKQQNALVIHYCKSVGIMEEQLKNVLMASPIMSFQDYANRVCSLFPAGYNTKPLDLFLEYQWNIGTKADGTQHDRTYPTLPGNMKGGYFIVPKQPGVYTEVRDGGALKYVNEPGTEHPFYRSENFMKSHKGTQQIAGQAAPANTAFNPGDGTAQASTWDAPAPGAAQ